MAHASALVFNELRLQQKLCDAVIRVQNEDFPIHRVILSGCSDFFRFLFTRKSHPDDRVYEIDQVSADIMRPIIEFAYVGLAAVNQQNVRQLYVACDCFQIKGLMDACCRFMGEHLSKDNCLDIWQLTETIVCPTLNRDAFHFIVQHFSEVCLSPEFLKLSVQKLLRLLESDQLLVKDEKMVFEAVLHWMEHLPKERTSCFPQLLSKVRLGLMTSEYLMTNVRKNKMVTCNTECQDIVQTAELLLSHGRVSPSGVYHPLARPRLPDSIILAIGGRIKNGVRFATNAIEAYDISVDRWVKVKNTDAAPRSNHGAVFLDGSVYCVGGYDMIEHLSGDRRFDLLTHKWHEVAPMKTRRCFFSITALNGRIYAIGGYSCWILNTAECYDPQTNRWTEIASMHERRRQASCTTFQGKVYICGGFSGESFLSSAEYYTPETNQWTMIAPMSNARYGLGVVALDELIYAVGGNNEGTHLNTAEAYNPQANSWKTVAPMLSPRSNFGTVAVGGLLFVIGGFNGSTYISNVESYNPDSGEWSAATSMGIARSGLSCCVLSGLINMADYAAPRDSIPDHLGAVLDLPSSEAPKAVGGKCANHGIAASAEEYNSCADSKVLSQLTTIGEHAAARP